MSYVPVVPVGGYAGWKFLTRTRASQEAAFVSSRVVQRDAAYFRDRIGNVTTAEGLVNDRRLLSVALGAFGLSQDIGNRHFVRKVLEDGTLDPKALANRLSDKRYLEFSKAFGFGDFSTPTTQLSDFADRILERYETRKFEEAVGEQDDQMRLAMNAERELAALAGRPISGDAKWFGVLGSGPLREVLQTAFGLPKSFVAIDLDQQLSVLKDRAQRYLGSRDVQQFSEQGKIDDLLRLFFLRSQVAGFGGGYASGQSAALTLLRSSAAGGRFLSVRI